MKLKPRIKYPDLDILVGANLRALRATTRISQEELAAGIGVSFQQIQKYENGKNRISCTTLYKISEILDVSVITFFKGLDIRTNKNPSLIDKESLKILSLYSQLKPAAKKSVREILRTLADT